MNLEEKEKTAAIFFDIETAYDKIDKNISYEILETMETD